MPFDADDIAAFNDSDMPAYALATIGAASVAGRFRMASEDVFGLTPTLVPEFSAASGDLSAVVPGDTVTIESTTYTVAAVKSRDEGQGMTRLRLKT